MRFGSVCSGIEAASVAWNPLGWKAQWLAEIEPFPCAVLAHHYPNTPNLGDMTKFESWPTDDQHAIDLLCGGTPCQSFSVAGLRKGLDDPRGNLMLTFGAIAAKYRPQWLVWENVPGVLSSNGGRDFGAFLDMLESLGYVCDIEILDAQFFGVPQRRRRVFVCAQHRDDLLSQKTDTSALTIAQCLQEILLCILSEARSRFGSEQGSSDLPSRSKDGAKRRMELFGLAGEADCWPMLLENLAAAFRRLPQEQRPLDATHGEPAKEPMPGVQSTDSQTASLFTLTEQSLKNALDDALEVMRLFITSTETSSTTQAQIFSCSRAALLIAQLTQRLSQSSPAFWNSALSSLTTVEEFTDYARSTSSDLFGDLERLQSWCDFIKQAEHSNDTFLGFGVECFGEIFPLPDCLQGHPAPRRESRKVAPTIPSRSTGGGGLGTDFDCDGGVIQVCPTLRAGGNRTGGDRPPGTDVDTADSLIPMAYGIRTANTSSNGWGIQEEVTHTLDCAQGVAVAHTTHTLRGEGFDASEDGTGRGTPLVPVRFAASFKGGQGSAAGGIGYDEHISPTLGAADSGSNRTPVILTNATAYRTAGDGAVFTEGNCTAPLTTGTDPCANILAFDTTQVTSVANRSNPKPGDPCHPLAAGAHAPAIAFDSRMRGPEPSVGREERPPQAMVERTGAIDATKPWNVAAAMQVRRLTPMEWARLQGFPDDYLDITVRGKPAADGPKYKALGNSWAVPNVRWIGSRIDAVAAIRQPSLDLEAA